MSILTAEYGFAIVRAAESTRPSGRTLTVPTSATRLRRSGKTQVTLKYSVGVGGAEPLRPDSLHVLASVQ